MRINEEIRSRVTYSVVLPRLGPEIIEQFILSQLDHAGLGHTTLTAETLTLIVRSSEGLAIEPVLMLGVSLLQFVDGLPDRAAVEMLRYHAGWNFALNRQLGDELFHPTSLVNFRGRLIEHGLGSVAFEAILDGLVEGANIRNLSQGILNLNALKIPIPPLATQQAIVAEIESEQALVASNRELVTLLEKKIQVTLARVWGEHAKP